MSLDLDAAIAAARPWRPPQRSASWVAGHALTRRLAPGGELHCSREYVPGDDPRAVDWAATARTGSLQVRTGPTPRAGALKLLLDASLSHSVGAHRPKWEVVLETAATISFSALAARLPVSIAVFNGASLEALPVASSKPVLYRQLLSLSAPSFEPGPLDLPTALETFLGATRGTGWCVVVSDLNADDPELPKRLSRSASLNTAFLVVHDRFDHELPSMGKLVLKDQVSGRVLFLDASSPEVHSALCSYRASRARMLASLPGPVLLLPTTDHISLAQAFVSGVCPPLQSQLGFAGFGEVLS